MIGIEKLISDNPFPENGRELNTKWIKQFQNSTDPEDQSRCIDRLIKLNIRCVALVKNKYASDFDYNDLLSMFYDVMQSAAAGYDFEYDTSDNSFLNYTVVKFRARLATERWRMNSIVRLPMASGKFAELVDVTEYSDIIPDDIDPEDEIFNELDELIENYERQELSDDAIERLTLLKLSRKYTFKEISNMEELNIGNSDRYVNTRVHRCINELIRFKQRCEREEDV